LEILLFLKWDTIREAKKKHEKFDNLYLRPFHIVATQYNNTYEFTHLYEDLFGALLNGRFLKNFLQY
jgi:hypothetical protein